MHDLWTDSSSAIIFKYEHVAEKNLFQQRILTKCSNFWRALYLTRINLKKKELSTYKRETEIPH